MPYEFLEGRPFWVVYFSLLGIVFARAQATYWIGRGLGAGVHRSRLGQRIGPRLVRAETLINRYGPPAVTFSFLTVGIQTAINLASGAMRMRFVRYLIAMFVGCLAWAAIYSLGGMAVVAAWWGLFLHSPWAAVGAAVVVLAAVVGVKAWRKRRSATGVRRHPRSGTGSGLGDRTAASSGALTCPGRRCSNPTADTVTSLRNILTPVPQVSGHGPNSGP